MPPQFDTRLPEDFDGVFRFTNFSDEEFIGKWNSRGYVFPAKSTTPMHILDATPLEVQNIRKKFARELAEREFFKSQKAKTMEATEKGADGSPRFNSIQMAQTYDDSHLANFIQQCLTALPVARPVVTELPKIATEENLHKDEEGMPLTEAVSPRSQLRARNLDK